MTTSSDHETHEDEEHIQIVIPLLQPLFVKLLRNFIVSGPNLRVHALGVPAGSCWAGPGTGRGVFIGAVFSGCGGLRSSEAEAIGFIGGVSSRSPSKSRLLLPGGK